MKGAFKITGKLLVYHIVFALVCFMFAPALLSEHMALRVALNVVVFGSVLLLAFNDGASQGERAATLSFLVEKRVHEGKVPTQKEVDSKYSPRKALAGALGAGLVLAALVALGWALTTPNLDEAVTGLFVKQPVPEGAEVFTAGMFAEVVLRAMYIPFVAVLDSVWQGFQGGALYAALAACSFLIPAAFFVGYMNGPRFRAKKLKEIEEGSRKKRRNLRVNKKPRKPRQQKPEV